jgi:hypothetical protein
MQRIAQAGALAGTLLALSASTTTTIAAQSQRPSRSSPSMLASVDFFYARPQGEFLRAVKQGFGGGGSVVIPTSDGILGLRIDMGYIGYGRKSRQVTVVVPPFGYPMSQTTTNNIFMFGIGPQFMVPTGPIRPYLNVYGGFSRFYTQSTLDDLDSNIFETTSTQSQDWKLSYGAGGGFTIPLVGGRMPILLDLGAAYHVNGRATYLTSQDVVPDPVSQTLIVTPRRSATNFMTYRLGMTLGF